MTPYRTLPVAMVLIAVLFVPGCSKTRTVTVTAAPAPGTFTVQFDHRVGGGPLMLNDAMYMGVDGAGNAYSVVTLRYFVSNVQLRTSGGVLYGVNGYHYRDAAIPATRDYTLGGVPAGTYDALVFTFGLDEQWQDAGNGIANDPNVAGMEWPVDWGGGWHYMILEGKYDPANQYGYRTHTGRRFIAASDSAARPHHFTVRLPFAAPVTIGGDAWRTNVLMELNEWYRTPTIEFAVIFPNGAGNIMVNSSVQALLEQNGPACFGVTQPVSP
jgi:hypothetical protein